MTGRVTFVGAGPGDAELLTLQAVRALQTADVILFDDLVSDNVLELARRAAQRLAAREVTLHLSWVGYYCTSLDMTGASISLLKLDGELTDLLEHPCDGFALRMP